VASYIKLILRAYGFGHLSVSSLLGGAILGVINKPWHIQNSQEEYIQRKICAILVPKRRSGQESETFAGLNSGWRTKNYFWTPVAKVAA
jgi:hypothetical protein